MTRLVVVNCDGLCGVEMTLSLKSDKAEGGFYDCDINCELRDCGWTTSKGKDLCERCSLLT